MLTKSFEETYQFGLKFAKRLKGGEVVGLVGDLGSGKTSFVKGLAEGLKVSETITSPTFVILKVYSGKIGDENIKLAHVDAYRLESKEDLQSIGLSEYFSSKSVLVIEWAEKIKNFLPENAIWINFMHLDGDKRKITIAK